MGAFCVDSMTDTDGVSHTAHVGEQGAAWATYPGYAVLGAVKTNRMRGTGSADYAYGIASGTPGSADYAVSADLVLVTNTDDAFGLLARADDTVSAGNDTYYYAAGQNGAGPDPWIIYKAVTGVFTELGSYSQANAGGTTYAVRLSLLGTSLKLFLDGVERVSVSDSAITAAGNTGYYLQTSDDTTGFHLDNFRAATASSLPPRRPPSPLLRM